MKLGKSLWLTSFSFFAYSYPPRNQCLCWGLTSARTGKSFHLKQILNARYNLMPNNGYSYCWRLQIWPMLGPLKTYLVATFSAYLALRRYLVAGNWFVTPRRYVQAIHELFFAKKLYVRFSFLRRQKGNDSEWEMITRLFPRRYSHFWYDVDIDARLIFQRIGLMASRVYETSFFLPDNDEYTIHPLRKFK